jgi:hypothetical protein
MNWKPYHKSRFRVIGIFNPTDTIAYPPKGGGNYVTAICLSKLSTDTGVVGGDVYVLFWPSYGEKCDAPNPPFQTGEALADSIERIEYKPYSSDHFEIIGSFTPNDLNTYPMPSQNGVYKVAKCKSVLSTDTDAIEGSTYIIIEYSGHKKVDAPNPPFQTGETIA